MDKGQKRSGRIDHNKGKNQGHKRAEPEAVPQIPVDLFRRFCAGALGNGDAETDAGALDESQSQKVQGIGGSNSSQGVYP